MWRIIVLTLCLFSSVAFAQTQERLKAIKFDEFGKAKAFVVKKKLDEFKERVRSEESAIGFILVVGEHNQRKIRIRQLLNNMTWLDKCFGQYTISVIDGGKAKLLKTTFWIIPQGAELPTFAQK